MSAPLSRRVGRLESAAPPPPPPAKPWRRIILEPGEPLPAGIDTENLIVRQIVDPPEFSEAISRDTPFTPATIPAAGQTRQEPQEITP